MAAGEVLSSGKWSAGSPGIQLELDVAGEFEERDTPLPQLEQGFEADCVDRNQVAEIQTQVRSVITADANEVGNLRLRQSPRKANQTVIGCLGDLNPAFHTRLEPQESCQTRSSFWSNGQVGPARLPGRRTGVIALRNRRL